MTKTEFVQQFNQLRDAGYQLPAIDGITIEDVIDDWFNMFGSCSLGEFSLALYGIMKTKTDSYWPAPDVIWREVFSVRTALQFGLKSQDPPPAWLLSAADVAKILSEARDSKQKVFAIGMSGRAFQVAPDQVLPPEDESGGL